MWVSHRNELDNTQVFFNKDNNEEKIIAPIYIGNKRYIIKDILSNSGGFGIIYIAIDTRLNNREVLVKANKYKPELMVNSSNNSNGLLNEQTRKLLGEMRRGIEIEKRTLVSLKTGKEARMPSVIDYIRDFSPQLKEFNIPDNICNNEPYLIMQKIQGTTLSSYRENKDTLNILEERGYDDISEWELDVLSYAYQLCTILDGFHKRSIIDGKKTYYIYQDLKPDNIILSHDKLITLLDFGAMTRVHEATINGELTAITDKTFGSPGVGSPGYKAPEAIENPYKIDERVDVYTLGATIFNLLTGIKLNEIIKTKYDRIPVEELLEDGYSKVTYEIVKKCTELDRNNRYKNMSEVRHEIGNAFSQIKRK